MAAREAGPICNANCLDPGRESCLCGLTPQHNGNFHWCLGQDTHVLHSWPIEGLEIPLSKPFEDHVQCPNCQTIFDSKTALRGLQMEVKNGP